MNEIASSIGVPFTYLMRDELDLDADKIPVKYPFILNLDTAGGTHWTMFMRVTKKKLFYVDSFGRPPPEELVNLAERHSWEILYIDDQIQDRSSVACGYFVMVAIKWLLKDSNIQNFASKIKSTFSTNLKANDSIVHSIVTSW